MAIIDLGGGVYKSDATSGCVLVYDGTKGRFFEAQGNTKFKGTLEELDTEQDCIDRLVVLGLLCIVIQGWKLQYNGSNGTIEQTNYEVDYDTPDTIELFDHEEDAQARVDELGLTITLN